MKYPKGAISKTEQMQALIDKGKPVFLIMHSSWKDREFIIFPGIGKFTPLEIDEQKSSVPFAFSLRVQEKVEALGEYDIAVERDWRVNWGHDGLFFFSNFWHAWAYVQKRNTMD